MSQLFIHLFGAFQVKMGQQPVENFRSYKVRALLAYLIAEGENPFPRRHLAELLWHGYELETAQASLRGALSNLRQLLQPLDLLHATRYAVQVNTNHPLLWCDLLTLQRFVRQGEQLDLVAWKQFAPTVQWTFLDGLRGIDSEPFQVWLSERQNDYRQQIEQLQQLANKRLATAQTPPTINLPRPLTVLIGREREITELSQRVLDPNYPLITLTGEGGVGKTRLALAVAERTHQAFANGSYFVELAPVPLTEPMDDQLALAIGAQLHLTFHAQAPLSQQLFTYLQAKQLLLILDNFEHLYTSAEFIVRLLAAAPQVTVLVTSRRRLDFQAELVMRLEGLAVPSAALRVPLVPTTITALQYSPSVQLFVERAARTTPGFALTAQNGPAVLQICHFVGGLPLGIELAAAHVEYNSCEQIADALQINFRLLTTTLRDLPARQRNMHSVLATSWQLLSPVERTTLMRCSVFRGSFSIAAAAAVTDSTVTDLALLEAHSLLYPDGEGRFHLHELVAQFAAEQWLATTGPAPNLPTTPALRTHQNADLLVDIPLRAEASALRDRHALYYLAILATWQHGVTIERDFQAMVQRDLANVRMAWAWALAQHQVSLLAGAYEGLSQYYQLVGLYTEAEAIFGQSIAHLRQLLTQPDLPALPIQQLLAQLLLKLAACYNSLSQSAKVVAASEEVLMWAARLGDPRLEMGGCRQLAVVAWVQGDYARQYQLLTRALQLAQQQGQFAEEVACYAALGLHGSATQTYPSALAALHKGLTLAQQRNYRSLETTVLTNLGIIYRDLGDFAQAIGYFQQNLQLSRQVGKQREIMLVIANLGTLAFLLGDYTSAITYLDEAQALVLEQGEKRIEAEVLAVHALLFEQMGNGAEALRYCRQTLAIAEPYNYCHSAREVWVVRGHVYLTQGDLTEALAAYMQANALSQTTAIAEELLQGQACVASVLLQQGQLRAALAEIEQLLPRFEAARFNPFQSPQRILLICYQVLAANHDPRAAQLLQRAWTLLQQQASKISDPHLRNSYLQNVPVNLELSRLAQSALIDLPAA